MNGESENVGIRYQIGDATRPTGERSKIIVHVCNDAGKWGKGFVLAVSRRWHEARERYLGWLHGDDAQPFALGQVQFIRVEYALWIANLIGQHGIGFQNGLPPIRYEAIREGLQTVAAKAQELDASVHMPRIGCGLAGGKWDEIEPIINQELVSKDVAVTVYDWPQRRRISSMNKLPRDPNPGQIQTAIEVLEKLAERIDNSAAYSMEHLPESKWADKLVERLEARTIEQTAAIESAVGNLQNWQDELRQQAKQSRSYHV
jgi:O-acetyl-ADP-ribose deacetylase (regulator of RNase III)